MTFRQQRIQRQPATPQDLQRAPHSVPAHDQHPSRDCRRPKLIHGSSIDYQERHKRIRLLPPDPSPALNPFNAPVVNALEGMFERVMALANASTARASTPSILRRPMHTQHRQHVRDIIKPEVQDTIASQSASNVESKGPRATTLNAIDVGRGHYGPVSIWSTLSPEDTSGKVRTQAGSYRFMLPPLDVSSTEETLERPQEPFYEMDDRAQVDDDVVELLSSEDEGEAEKVDTGHEGEVDYEDGEDFEEYSYDEEEEHHDDYEDEREEQGQTDLEDKTDRPLRSNVSMKPAQQQYAEVVELDDSEDEDDQDGYEVEEEEDEEEAEEDDEDKENRVNPEDLLRWQQNAKNTLLHGSMGMSQPRAFGFNLSQHFEQDFAAREKDYSQGEEGYSQGEEDYSQGDEIHADVVEEEDSMDAVDEGALEIEQEMDDDKELQDYHSDSVNMPSDAESEGQQIDEQADPRSSPGASRDGVVLLRDDNDEYAEHGKAESDQKSEIDDLEGQEEEQEEGEEYQLLSGGVEQVSSGIVLGSDQLVMDSESGDGSMAPVDHEAGELDDYESRVALLIEPSSAQNPGYDIAGEMEVLAEPVSERSECGSSSVLIMQAPEMYDRIDSAGSSLASQLLSSDSDIEADTAHVSSDLGSIEEAMDSSDPLYSDDTVEMTEAPPLVLFSDNHLSTEPYMVLQQTTEMVQEFTNINNIDSAVPLSFLPVSIESVASSEHPAGKDRIQAPAQFTTFEDDTTDHAPQLLTEFSADHVSLLERLRAVAQEEHIPLSEPNSSSTLDRTEPPSTILPSIDTGALVAASPKQPDILESPSSTKSPLMMASDDLALDLSPSLPRRARMARTSTIVQTVRDGKAFIEHTATKSSSDSKTKHRLQQQHSESSEMVTSESLGDSTSTPVNTPVVSGLAESAHVARYRGDRGGMKLLVEEARAFCSGVPVSVRTGSSSNASFGATAPSSLSSLGSLVVDTLSPSLPRAQSSGSSPSRLTGIARRRISLENGVDPPAELDHTTGVSTAEATTSHQHLGVVDLVAEKVIQSTVVGSHALRPFITSPASIGQVGTSVISGSGSGSGQTGSRSNSQEPHVASPKTSHSHMSPSHLGMSVFSFGQQAPFGNRLGSPSVGFGFGSSFVSIPRESSVGGSPSSRKAVMIPHHQQHEEPSLPAPGLSETVVEQAQVNQEGGYHEEDVSEEDVGEDEEVEAEDIDQNNAHTPLQADSLVNSTNESQNGGGSGIMVRAPKKKRTQSQIKTKNKQRREAAKRQKLQQQYHGIPPGNGNNSQSSSDPPA
ncbi:hypothetical protein BC939DRAFT_458515 [Gamsiella multidivaricata]|uniref:uncharacterized protein n=1 Tax=Gamsiella multidivaricata TaxID=101098 RepID=UPI002220528B|nr:uncharacterized protein BC939DRAFT_458515 [Gamsiella multidivaricata]KAG0366948.1 hypothetical protein BGZ54_004665 [Gamsiella multidivaricata]KAI7820173.1 hypothetical protein BC939DRAFT_458515 [Gamsiella multidivaricata]